jgi:hypothetical protein
MRTEEPVFGRIALPRRSAADVVRRQRIRVDASVGVPTSPQLGPSRWRCSEGVSFHGLRAP